MTNQSNWQLINQLSLSQKRLQPCTWPTSVVSGVEPSNCNIFTTKAPDRRLRPIACGLPNNEFHALYRAAAAVNNHPQVAETGDIRHRMRVRNKSWVWEEAFSKLDTTYVDSGSEIVLYTNTAAEEPCGFQKHQYLLDRVNFLRAACFTMARETGLV